MSYSSRSSAMSLTNPIGKLACRHLLTIVVQVNVEQCFRQRVSEAVECVRSLTRILEDSPFVVHGFKPLFALHWPHIEVALPAAVGLHVDHVSQTLYLATLDALDVIVVDVESLVESAYHALETMPESERKPLANVRPALRETWI